MLFNSIEFAVFLPIVFLLYWFVLNRNIRLQNLLILVSSYIFYGWWDWRFLSLIAFSSLVDYSVGIQLAKTEQVRKRKVLLLLSILVNLGFLGFFKYFNFFAENFAQAFTLLGRPIEPSTLHIILPVGISFYTFQTLSYTIDVYRHKMKAERDILAFFAYVSFFPQLVAGPIERAKNLLPQFIRSREFDYHQAVSGMQQILWGLFKKIVIADNCAPIVNETFAHPEDHLGSRLLLAAVLFAFQIYCDFSGYSDIAIGTGRLFGFNLMRNFNLPYFSRDIAEFWRRWHISLSTWFRDYVYIPMGGSKGGRWQQIRNVLIIFVVSGFWHGANWTFIVWGLLNALFFLPLILMNQNRQHLDVVASGKILPSLKEIGQMGITFSLTLMAWIVFRAESISAAWIYFQHMFFENLVPHPGQFIFFAREALSSPVMYFILFMLILEWVHRDREFAFQVASYPVVLRRALYFTVFAFIFFWGAVDEAEFIYFQF